MTIWSLIKLRLNELYKCINNFGLMVGLTTLIDSYGRQILPYTIYLYLMGIRHKAVERYVIKNVPVTEYIPDQNQKINKLIWFLWFQGELCMPLTVKLCYDNVKKNSNGTEVKLVTSDNWESYVSLPENIVSKYRKGMISNTHFSDILRMGLLSNYGGLWMDATILLTTPLPPEVYEQPIFCIHHKRVDQFVFAGRWSIFFLAIKDKAFPKYVFETLINYYSTHDDLIDYFLTDYIIDIGYRKYPELKLLIDSIPINNPCSHYLKNQLKYIDNNDDIKKVINGTVVSTWAHKLTYKNGETLGLKLFEEFCSKLEQNGDLGLVTVAMSIYNVEEYLDTAIRCVVEQSYRNLEILIIDDASTDKSFKIANKWAKRDSRIRVVRQNSNYGLSVSRNRAIQEANGEYLLMLDGDDLFDRDMVYHAVEKAESENSDMVVWDYLTFSDEQEIPQQVLIKSELIGLESLSLENLRMKLLRRPAFMWVRLIRTSMLRSLGVQFTPGLTKQDIPIHWQLVTSLKNISILPEKLSFYRQQPNATSCRKGESLFSLAKVMDITEDYLKRAGKYDTYRAEFLRSRLSLLHGMYDFIYPDLKKTALDLVRDRYNDDAKQYILSSECELTPRVRYFYGAIAGNRIDKIKYKGIIYFREVYRAIKRILKR